MNKRVNEIDLLRFAAALAVVFYHYAFRGYAANDMSIMPYPLLARFAKYGYLSVNLFFMISGFVILMTAAEGSLRRFIVSRITRLYPVFWICCTVTFVTTLILGGERYFATASQYLINLTMLSEFFNAQPIDGAYWSLFVEIKFYLLIAAILLVKKINYAQIFFFVWLIVSILLEFVYHNGYLYYWLAVNYSAYFIAGAMYFLIWSQGISFARLSALFASWGLASLQALNDAAFRIEHYRTPMNQFLVVEIVSLFFAIMLLVSVKKTGFVGRISWAAIGALTYPLYLLHQYIGFMIFNAAYPAVNSHVLLWGVILLILCAAYAISVLEKKISPPFKNALKRFFDYLLPANQTHKP